MYDSFADRKVRLAKRVRKGDSDFLHAQLVLAGQTVTSDKIVGTTHSYRFDCGCVRACHLDISLGMRETLEPCKRHEGLPALALPRRFLR